MTNTTQAPRPAPRPGRTPRVRIVGTRPMPADEALNSMAYAAAEGLQGDGTMQAAMWHDVLCEVLDALDEARDDTVQLAHADRMIATLTRERDGLYEDRRALRAELARLTVPAPVPAANVADELPAFLVAAAARRNEGQ